ncbi:MAG: 30S ribosomal protein S4 [Dehalococcoidia bacterium]|nr:30S ribosomal protein S4 [Dehalococcoidia bacterium]
MGRYAGPVCRLCRRVGEKLFLKGERCFTPRCAIERRRTPPGNQSGRRRRVSDHGIQLREKQKARYIYGIMEGQFRRYMSQAFKRPGVTGQYLLELLERRLDNAVYRLGFAESRRQARQLVLHGHFTVNGRKTNIPSYMLRPGDVIAWKESHKQRDFFKALTEDIPKRPVPSWLDLDTNNMTGNVSSVPAEEDLESAIDTRLIVEFYSR